MKITLYPAVSLDGFIADADGDSDWVTEQDGALFENAAKEAGCIVVGRKTFEQYQGDLFPIDGTLTIVVTSQPDDYQSSDSVVYAQGDASTIVELAKSKGHEQLLLAGGGETNGLFAKENLIDEVIISIYPTVMGSGVRVLGSFEGKLDLKLIGSQVLEASVVQNKYEVVK